MQSTEQSTKFRLLRFLSFFKRKKVAGKFLKPSYSALIFFPGLESIWAEYKVSQTLLVQTNRHQILHHKISLPACCLDVYVCCT